MKKTAITILAAFLIGGALATFTIYKFDQSVFSKKGSENAVTAFQIGVYKSLENAQSIAKEYPSAVSIKDGDYYRVYIGVASNEESATILKDYFGEKNVNCYPKKINVTKTFLEELNQMETLFAKTDKSVYDSINQEIMKKLPGELL